MADSVTKTIDEVLPLARPSITADDIAAVLDVLSTPILSMGPRVRAFERAIADYVGVKEAVAVNSGTSGLHLCLAALDIGLGDEVITSPFSFVASANCILYQGATPVFVDIDPHTLTIDPDLIEAAITERTRAILPVDVFGQPAAAERIDALGEKYGLPVIYDSCESLGAERHGYRAGHWGKAAVFAFYPNKQITTGEGGMIVSDDADFARILRSLCNQGRDDNGTWMNHVRLGYNYRLDEMSAALGLSQLQRVEELLDKRARVANWYNERILAIPDLAALFIAPETTRMSWFVYVVRIAAQIERDRLMERLANDGIPTRPYFVPIHLQPLYRQRFGFQAEAFPISETAGSQTLALPFFPDMSEQQVEFVCTRLRVHLTELNQLTQRV